MNMKINAASREDQGKGASRRLRHQEKVPAIVYGAGKTPSAITLNAHEITHLLENEEAYTSVLDLVLDDKTEPVIVKDLQRHPAKNTITHLDLLRVDMKQSIVTNIPLHFIGEDENQTIRLGAVLNQFITSVEISCLPADLPNGIEVDISKLEMNEHISLTELIIPAGVTLIALTHGDIEAHDQSVVAVQEPKKMAEIEEDIVPETEGEDGESVEGEGGESADGEDKGEGESGGDKGDGDKGDKKDSKD
ncbi:MAG: 50S ribosomal protein L25/general stress protein Ctc [Candidatus Thioglobus sp.]|nr:50S ribosomal protein L25/general stress protein Ctc [Candidatus Thioglobus sp.]